MLSERMTFTYLLAFLRPPSLFWRRAERFKGAEVLGGAVPPPQAVGRDSAGPFSLYTGATSWGGQSRNTSGSKSNKRRRGFVFSGLILQR